jgi:DNA-binding transcriptional MocR family regulator
MRKLKTHPPIHRPGVIFYFYSLLLGQYGTFVGPGHWFEMDRRYMRVGNGGPTNEELRTRLESITRAIREVLGRK